MSARHYSVSLRADVMLEWEGEAESRQHAIQQAYDSTTDGNYEVDFGVEGVWSDDADDA